MLVGITAPQMVGLLRQLLEYMFLRYRFNTGAAQQQADSKTS
jgi:hypothetical protein